MKTPTRFFKVGSGYWLRVEASPSVFSAMANGCNPSIEVGNIFCETRILAFSHSLADERTSAVLTLNVVNGSDSAGCKLACNASAL